MHNHSYARTAGVTLLELMLTLAIIGVLVTLSVFGYRYYIVRAQTAQTLLNIDQIATVVRVENRTLYSDLEVGAEPGKAPPKLKGLVSDLDFQDRAGNMLWLIKAPAGTFASYPDRATYALVARAANDDALTALRALRALRKGLPHGDSDAPWLDAYTFAFPLEALATAAAPGPGGKPDCSKGTAWGAPSSQTQGKTWTGSAVVVVCGNGTPLTDVKAGVKVRVVLKVRAWDGTVSERSWEEGGGELAGGYATFTTPNLGMGEGETILELRYVVVRVDYYYPTDPAVKWDGGTPGITVPMPGGPVGTRRGQAPGTR